MERALRIGEVAAVAGVPTPTLRFYERRGLLKARGRRDSGYRIYAADDVKTVRFIKRAQSLGFSLREVRELLSLRDEERACGEVRRAAELKLKAVDEKLHHLNAMRGALSALLKTCGDRGGRRCPLLEALDES
jgi:DNA-binding transcriptional MerR regulator